MPRPRSDADTELEVDVEDDMQTIRGQIEPKSDKPAQDGISPRFSNRGELVYELSRTKLDKRVKRLVDKNDISEPIFVMSTHRRNTVDLPTARIIHLGVEPVLLQSRVYRRCASNVECDQSFVSSLAKTPWSIFSGFSLADISILSVVALPISIEEAKSFQQIIVADESGMKPSTSSNPPEIDSPAFYPFGNFNNASDTQSSDLEDVQFEELLARHKQVKRRGRPRLTLGSIAKRPRAISESIGSDTDPDYPPVKARHTEAHRPIGGLTLSTAKEVEVVNIEARVTKITTATGTQHFVARRLEPQVSTKWDELREKAAQNTQNRQDQNGEEEEEDCKFTGDTLFHVSTLITAITCSYRGTCCPYFGPGSRAYWGVGNWTYCGDEGQRMLLTSWSLISLW